MALNISKQVDSRPKSGAFSQDFMQKHKITVNEPVQAHFSVEGVQTYSADEIKAMKARADRVNAEKDGTFIKPTAYKIDDEIDFGDGPTAQIQQFRTTLKAKTKKQQLQQAKPQENSKRKIIKPSIRNQMSRTNQQSVKLTKHLQKKQLLQQKMQQLTNKYKKHFGDSITKNTKSNKQQVSNEEQLIKQDENNQNQAQIGLQEEEGEQLLPSFENKQKSMTTLPKTRKNKNEGVNDDSFQQIEWEQPLKNNQNVSISSSKAGAYSERLGDAVHFLFD